MQITVTRYHHPDEGETDKSALVLKGTHEETKEEAAVYYENGAGLQWRETQMDKDEFDNLPEKEF